MRARRFRCRSAHQILFSSLLGLAPAALIVAPTASAATPTGFYEAQFDESQRRVPFGDRENPSGAERRNLLSQQTPPPSAESRRTPQPRSSARAEPGRLEVDAEAAERALERALVTTGALLLPAWQLEIEPSFGYTHNERSTVSIFTDETEQQLAMDRVRQDIVQTALSLRLGLPWQTQLELAIPYRYVNQEVVTEVGFGPRAQSRDEGSTLGDLRVALARTLMSERGWRPDLVGRVSWDTDTGKSGDGNIARSGLGHHELEVSLTALKRQDPLVFLAGVSYYTVLEQDDYKPGAGAGLTLGVLLAASPATSLRVVLQQTFIGEAEVDGQSVDGSSQRLGSLQVGASSVLGPGRFVDVTATAGLTPDAADYAFEISYSTRFDLWRR
jgi:hypothetical protein